MAWLEQKITKEIKHLNIKITPKGQKIELWVVDVFYLMNRKIDIAREYTDYTTIMRQIGVEAAAEISE